MLVSWGLLTLRKIQKIVSLIIHNWEHSITAKGYNVMSCTGAWHWFRGKLNNECLITEFIQGKEVIQDVQDQCNMIYFCWKSWYTNIKSRIWILSTLTVNNLLHQSSIICPTTQVAKSLLLSSVTRSCTFDDKISQYHVSLQLSAAPPGTFRFPALWWKCLLLSLWYTLI